MSSSVAQKNSFTVQVCSNVCPYVVNPRIKNHLKELLNLEKKNNDSRYFPLKKTNSQPHQPISSEHRIEKVILHKGRVSLKSDKAKLAPENSSVAEEFVVLGKGRCEIVSHSPKHLAPSNSNDEYAVEEWYYDPKTGTMRCRRS